jgi:excisionase family DNA binding protein
MHAEPIAPALERAPERKEPLHVKDIAHATGWSKATVYAEIKSGRLPSYRIGTGRGSIRVPRAAFTQYIDERGIPAAELAVAL